MSCTSIHQSIECMCGEFSDPAVPDLGQATPYRLKIDCEAPAMPALSAISYDPDADPQFTAS